MVAPSPWATLAATGVRLTITLARENQRSGLRLGVASACIGGGQGYRALD